MPWLNRLLVTLVGAGFLLPSLLADAPTSEKSSSVAEKTATLESTSAISNRQASVPTCCGSNLVFQPVRNWPAARAAFEAVARRWPNDKAAKLMAVRCEVFAQEDAGDHWDGVFVLETK